MTVHIDSVGGALLVVACVVGYFVYKHTQLTPTGKGDVVGAIVCATAVLTALILVLGGDHTDPQTPSPTGGGVPTSPTPRP
ncbi:hypothetical protein [Streptomyces mirabilis]|uniref:hypothetical protein n=1 Tax=Streptomyces mirabilis TaxID=68239 RepID=UPI0036CF747E